MRGLFTAHEITRNNAAIFNGFGDGGFEGLQIGTVGFFFCWHRVLP